MKLDEEVQREKEKGEEMEKDMSVCFGSPLPFTNFYFHPFCGSGLKWLEGQ